MSSAGQTHIGDCDAVYMTRLQDEWDVEGESKAIDYDHPDLQANIWTNPGEIPGN